MIQLWVFLWCLSTSGLKKVLPQREHTNLTPRCTFLTWAQIAACEVDGPSLQPSTQHWYTCFVPPICILRGCIWASMSPSGAGVAAGQTLWPGLQDLKLQVLWTLERVVGKQRNWELSEIFLEEVGRGEGGSTMWLPSRVHRYLLPLILLLPPSCSPPLHL